MFIDEDTMQELEDIVFDRNHAHATCNNCGHSQDVEPDANYPCPECNEGRLRSQLVMYGLI